MEMTLVLNSAFEPISVVPWTRAMVLWAKGAVEIVSEHDVEKRAVSFAFKVPSVIRLLRYIRTHSRRATVPWTRANIYRRDSFTCQYCGTQEPSEDLTFDHVIPASRGGRKDWQNIVTCCLSCNRKKNDRTPEEAGMPLLRQPRVPPPSPIFRVSLGIRKTPESWRSFLYWHAELEA